jgi:hypothetical protein
VIPKKCNFSQIRHLKGCFWDFISALQGFIMAKYLLCTKYRQSAGGSRSDATSVARFLANNHGES